MPPKDQVHPIAWMLLQIASEKGAQLRDRSQLRFSAADMEDLQGAMLELADYDELQSASRNLMQLAAELEKTHRAKEASHQIILAIGGILGHLDERKEAKMFVKSLAEMQALNRFLDFQQRQRPAMWAPHVESSDD